MKYHVISIGVSRHQNPGNNLAYPSKDASEFFSLFTENISDIGFTRLLVDSEATLSSIQTVLGKELLSQISEDDCFIFYYSGHGTVAMEDERYSHFLVPFDVTDDISNSAISVEFLNKTFEKITCKAKLIFVDTCFSGAVNSKYYGLSYKDLKSENIKSISEISGEGSLVFTACKDSERAVESPDLENGVFTSFLLKEFQANLGGQARAVTDIFRPVTENVIKYVEEKFHHTQTPTFSGSSKGVLYLPVFRKPLKVNPEIIGVPDFGINPATFTVPKVETDIEEDEGNDLVKQTINFVRKTSSIDVFTVIEFEKFCIELSDKLYKEWEDIYSQPHQSIEEKLPEAVARIEGHSLQIFVLAGILALYGNSKQVEIFSESIFSILKKTRHKSGLVVLISLPEVVLVTIQYIFATFAISTGDFSKLKALMNSRVYGYEYNTEPPKLIKLSGMHYSQALTGYATKVNDHMRDSLSRMDWLTQMHPRLKNLPDIQIQANLLLVVLFQHNQARMYPDFGRWNAERVMPFVEKIKYDQEYRTNLANLFDLPEEKLRLTFSGIVSKLHKDGLSSHHWTSINYRAFLLKEELEKEEDQDIEES